MLGTPAGEAARQCGDDSENRAVSWHGGPLSERSVSLLLVWRTEGQAVSGWETLQLRAFGGLCNWFRSHSLEEQPDPPSPPAEGSGRPGQCPAVAEPRVGTSLGWHHQQGAVENEAPAFQHSAAVDGHLLSTPVVKALLLALRPG